MGMISCFGGKREGKLGRSKKGDSKTLQPRTQGICIVTTEHTVGSHKKKYLVSIKRERIFIHSSSADLDKKPLGHISLDGSFLTVLTNTRFRIQSPNEKKTFFFTAPSVKERNEWLLGLAERKGLRRRAKDYYDLGKFMGSGSNCDVHECTHKLTKKVYAFKHMSKEKMDVKGRLYNELKILVHTSKYRHPGIVHMEDWFFDHDNRIVIIMELLTGGELFSRILQKRRFPEPEARATTQEIVSALRYLHKRGIAHRDLKPENLIYENNEPGAALKIVDFDLSKFFHKTMRATTPCGTISYNAPEIVRREPYSQAVDVWSLGVVVYVLVSGRLPFSGRTDAEREKKIAVGNVNFPKAHWSHVSSAAKDFTAKLLEPNPELRPTIEEVANHPWLLEGIPIPDVFFKDEPTPSELPVGMMHPLKDVMTPAGRTTNGESANGTPATATTPYSEHSNYTPHRDTSYVKFNLDVSQGVVPPSVAESVAAEAGDSDDDDTAPATVDKANKDADNKGVDNKGAEFKGKAAVVEAAPVTAGQHAHKRRPEAKRDSRTKAETRADAKGDKKGGRVGGKGGSAAAGRHSENENDAPLSLEGREDAVPDAAHVRNVISTVTWLGGKYKGASLSSKRSGEGSSRESPSSHKHHHKGKEPLGPLAPNGQHKASHLQHASAPAPGRVSPPSPFAGELDSAPIPKTLQTHALVDEECLA